ncbi:MSF1-domain-containing protein [Cucurbitaria berberidis CBS 394.84]|uniref:MSF1-domain-containing protein n=1 Tax=Cucurbitaria berberidis CBS 394.84 TaxID=1168544 RepID=A0A9P4LBJ6_9PLEO|nr:MSF1-domain-containing protein [Cucurbitaria berberidis CBS 394.84]KAF1849666.1 MSF1-domain-containing protein [Cucurbitaria berberidis CBS 394.84]
MPCVKVSGGPANRSAAGPSETSYGRIRAGWAIHRGKFAPRGSRHLRVCYRFTIINIISAFTLAFICSSIHYRNSQVVPIAFQSNSLECKLIPGDKRWAPHFPDRRFIAHRASAGACFFALYRHFLQATLLHDFNSSPPHTTLIHAPSRPITFNTHPAHIPKTRRVYTERSTSTTPDYRHTITMKYFQQTVDFDYSWEEVSTNNWQKYGPWNELTPHVIAVDTLSRAVDPATGILRTERLITCQQSTPKWINCILGGQDTSMVYETSYVDPVAKKLTLCSMNVTWADLLNVRETCTYQPAPSNSASRPKTQFTQRAEITALCGGWQKIKNSIEQFTVERFQQNAAMGKEGFEMVLEKARQVFHEQRELLRLQQESPILRQAKI